MTVEDFQAAGGVLLLVLSSRDLLHPALPLRQPGTRPGVVPLGIPMIAGPFARRGVMEAPASR